MAKQFFSNLCGILLGAATLAALTYFQIIPIDIDLNYIVGFCAAMIIFESVVFLVRKRKQSKKKKAEQK
ncbi:MAG: hypothetical protein LBP62_02130 [Clostridiales bacterium]|nr:hypothetical protein [Clostridiales bacterium]